MEERISVKKVSKKFKIGFKKNQSALARFVSLFSGKEPKKLISVLDKISFNVKKGEILGIIGKNGSGKSTLLRCLAGIYDFEGRIKTEGKIISLISLNAGLQSRLTMKDNIFLIGSLFGLSRKEIKRSFDSILDFCELFEFINTKPYQFSEGMKQRLVFSIAIHCNPKILLLDEVFEVGDEIFRKKSADKIKELVEKGTSVVLVSHDLNMVEKYADKTILMDKGKIIKIGESKEVIEHYRLLE
jgi:ABC-type polysaccharide/polyol phosphate transport system ATPase subunit